MADLGIGDGRTGGTVGPQNAETRNDGGRGKDLGHADGGLGDCGWRMTVQAPQAETAPAGDWVLSAEDVAEIDALLAEREQALA